MAFATTQRLLLAFYVALPLFTLSWAIYSRARHARSWPLASFVFTIVTAVALGGGYLLLNRWLFAAHVPPAEGFRFVYLLIAAICLLKLIDKALLWGVFRLFKVRMDRWGRPTLPNHTRAILGLLVQRLALFCLMVPYLAALIVTYRPRLLTSIPPADLKDLNSQNVRFASADGIALAALWIPAGEMPSALEADLAQRWAKRTIILCHGFGSSKENELHLARALAAQGYNILALDFRGHGQSTGNFISFGDRERLDILAAVEWIRHNTPAKAERIFGVGSNTGAAALLAAAADEQTGQAIDALVLYEPFADLGALAHAAAEKTLPGGVDRLVCAVGLPIASLHAGANLAAFIPSDYAQHIWPRPILVVHGRGQTFIPLTEPMSLFQQAPFPKEQFWPSDNYPASRKGTRKQEAKSDAAHLAEMFREWLGAADPVWADPGVQQRTFRFLDEAHPIPAI